MVNQGEVRTEGLKERKGGGIETKTGKETVIGSAAIEIKIEKGIEIEGGTGIEIATISETGVIGTVGSGGKIDTLPLREIMRVWVMEVKRVRSQRRHNQKKVHRMG